MHDFQKLKVWQMAMELTKRVYECSRSFPKEERFGLTQQMTRSAVSIPSNISEGAGRNSEKEFNYFLGIANGSSFELQTQWILARNFGFLNEENYSEVLDKIDHVQKMIFKLQQTIKTKINNQ